MNEKRVPLYERLPEIYRIKDEETTPKYQLEHYLALVESVFNAIHANIEALYDDLFIETCDPWVIPYIGDLLGVTHLTGDPWTLRADVADTIALRRRKGTLASIERLVYNLTRWGVHCVELRENLVWNQHLNHQRPDAGGLPPYSGDNIHRNTPIRGGTINFRDPAMLSLLYTPFDPFAHVVDVKPPSFGKLGYNLPNLAIFLWRLEDYRVRLSKPLSHGIQVIVAPTGDEATHVVRFEVHPMGEPLRLFNTYQFDPDTDPPVVTQVDETPGPIHPARLNSKTSTYDGGNPEAYLSVDPYNPAELSDGSVDIADVGLQLHIPEANFADESFPPPPGNSPVWSIRGDNLCAWETGLARPLMDREIVVDPLIGRIVIGAGKIASGNGAARGAALEADMLLTYTYGFSGSVGAHPVSRSAAPLILEREDVDRVEVNYHVDPNGLQTALDGLDTATQPVVIEIMDSMVHVLDLSTVGGIVIEDGGPNLVLNKSLVIRAADSQRPVIQLTHPLRFRSVDLTEPASQSVRLEGLYLTRSATFTTGEPLIARAALDRLEVIECSLDPGGFEQLDGTPAPIHTSMRLVNIASQRPRIVLRRSIVGPMLIDGGYALDIQQSILDAGVGVGDDPDDKFALTSATNPQNEWGPPTSVYCVTVFGRMRVASITGRGGIWVHALEVWDNQKGCLRYSYYSGEGDRLPQNLGCVFGTDAILRFVSESFGQPGYAQLAHRSDFRIKERGPEDAAMGAFGFLLEAHKWRNLHIRFREFMPVGVRPLLIPVT